MDVKKIELRTYESFANLVAGLLEDKEFKQLLHESSDPARNLVNAVETFTENPALQSLALLGAAIAITKRDGIVQKDTFMGAAEIIWALQEAKFDNKKPTVQ